MTTSLYLDKETKLKASKKAKKDKLSFSAVVRILLSDYADGKIVIGARPGNVFNAERDNDGKGIPVDDFIAMLKKYDGQGEQISAKIRSTSKKKTSRKNK